MTLHNVAITSKGGIHHVVLDGVDITGGLASAAYSAPGYDRRAEVTLEVLTDTTVINADEVEVTIPEAAAAVLVQLGWTPPGGDA